MNAVVLGNGGSGKAAAALLRRDGWCVTVLDGTDVWPECACDLCVTSPGIPVDHPWQNTARAKGVRIISELQLGAERYRALGGRMLAVTGSKGKSSVVKLVADALDGIPCGNYGKPLCEVVLDFMETDSVKAKGRTLENEGTDPKKTTDNCELPIAVVEVSSFQLETTELPSDTFEAAAILNLQEDHLDRHGSVAKYHDLKRKLLNFSSVKIEGTGPEIAVIKGLENKDINKYHDLFADSYFDNPILQENGRFAAALLKAAGLGDGAIRAAFMRFDALPHRMQTIGIFNGVTWIDDSKATSISALIAGVTMAFSRFNSNSSNVFGAFKGFLPMNSPINQRVCPHGAHEIAGPVPKVRLIAGGVAKGDDPAMARACLANGVAKVYLIGQCAPIFAKSWKDVVPCEMCGTMEVAVAKAKTDSREGDCVLLSPGTASFDHFKNYGERGDRFASLASSIYSGI